MRGIIATALVAVTVLAWASTAGAQATHDVEVQDNAYAPASITITEGDTVRWTQTGDNPHSVTSSDGSAEQFDSHPNCTPLCMMNGDTYEHTFDEAGSFSYQCDVHGAAMSGTVVVEAAQVSPTPTDTVTTTPTPTDTATTTPTPTQTATSTATSSVSPTQAEQELPETGAPLAGLAATGALALLGGLLAHRRGR